MKRIYFWQYVLLFSSLWILGIVIKMAIDDNVAWQIIVCLPISTIVVMICIYGMILQSINSEK